MSPTAISRRHGAKFIVADTPGHEQYTRNMATGASRCRPRGHPGRCPQGPACGRPTGTASSPTCSASATSCLPSTRWTWSAMTRRRSSTSPPSTASSAANSALPTSPPSRCRRSSGDNVTRAGRAIRPGTHGPTLLAASRGGRRRRGPRQPRRSGCRCSGCAGRTSIFAALPAPLACGRLAVGDAVVVLPSARTSTVTAHPRSRRTAANRCGRRRRHRRSSPTRSTSAAAT